MSYDLLIQANLPLFSNDGGSMGGTERQILTVAETLSEKGVNVGILHSIGDGTDKIINGVKHLNVFRHHYAKSKVRVTCNHFNYFGNQHISYGLYSPHVKSISPLEINSSEKIYNWMHNWFACHDEIPRIFNSNAIKNYVYEKGKKVIGDQVIHYMIPKGIEEPVKENRKRHLYWMSAFGKGMKEAITVYIGLYEKGLNRDLYISIPPQRLRKDVQIVHDFIRDSNKFNYPITFLGELDYKNSMKNLSNSACLFRPTMPQETFGLVYLEANKLGVPVITYKGDAGEEILTDKNNMFIDDKTTLDNILKWMENIENKKTSVDMKKFDPEVISKKWISLLEK